MDELRIEYIPVSKLRPYEKNARLHDKKSVESIANSAVNLFALAKGYDAIEGGYTMVLNRRCLTVSKTTKSTQGRSSW